VRRLAQGRLEGGAAERSGSDGGEAGGQLQVHGHEAGDLDRAIGRQLEADLDVGAGVALVLVVEVFDGSLLVVAAGAGVTQLELEVPAWRDAQDESLPEAREAELRDQEGQEQEVGEGLADG